MSSVHVNGAFAHVKAAYEKLREQERVNLRKYLSAHEGLRAAGLKVIAQGGKGSAHYRGNYDLRNWKWVEVKGPGGFDAVISLNMLDIDPKTKNVHSLYDRIGLMLSPEKWVYTDIDLPLDDKAKERIAQLILKCLDLVEPR